MGVNGAWIVVVLLVFLAVVVMAGSGAGRARRGPRLPRPAHPGARIAEDTDPDDISDETTPSRSDD
jgi:hypothetical protein